SAWMATAATFFSCGLTPGGMVTPNWSSMVFRLCTVKGVWLVRSPLPSSPTTSPYPTSGFPRTPATCARSLMRSACTSPATISTATIATVARTRPQAASGAGAHPGRTRAPATFPHHLIKSNRNMAWPSVRECSGIEEPAEPAHRVGTRQRAATPVEDLGLANAIGADPVVGSDIGRPHQPLNLHQLVALVQAHALLAGHAQVAVAQVLDHADGDVAGQLIALGAVAAAGEIARAVDPGLQHRASANGHALAEEGRRRHLHAAFLADRSGGIG